MTRVWRGGEKKNLFNLVYYRTISSSSTHRASVFVRGSVDSFSTFKKSATTCYAECSLFFGLFSSSLECTRWPILTGKSAGAMAYCHSCLMIILMAF
jgi:hypothetical protein